MRARPHERPSHTSTSTPFVWRANAGDTHQFQLGDLGKEGVKLSPLTPQPLVTPSVTISDLTKYQELADADGGNSADNVVVWHHDSYREYAASHRHHPSY